MLKILIITGPDFEDIELYYPYYRLLEAGYKVDIAAPRKERISGKHGYTIYPDMSLVEVDPREYYALVIPGGRGPERIRVLAREDAIRIIRHFMDNSKPVAAICHGPQLLISADRVRGRRLTSYPGIMDDIIKAGGKWLNQEVVVDNNLVTSRIPSDIPYWFREFMKILSK